VRDFEVLPEELEWKTEEGLILKMVSRSYGRLESIVFLTSIK